MRKFRRDGSRKVYCYYYKKYVPTSTVLDLINEGEKFYVEDEDGNDITKAAVAHSLIARDRRLYQFGKKDTITLSLDSLKRIAKKGSFTAYVLEQFGKELSGEYQA